MRAVGTRPTRRQGRVPKGTPAAAVIPVPAIEMAGYPCQMPTASAAQNLNTTRSQMPRRGQTAVASRFNGWETTGKWGMRAVGTRPIRRQGRVPKGTPAAAVIPVPAIEMAGYPCQMPTASAAQNLNTMRSQMPHRGQTAVASRFNGWGNQAMEL
ncbi:MAG: hypothetical protein IKR50_04305 [Prevotella sp.]|nr:hypothetical protein [Prevotella sp.]